MVNEVMKLVQDCATQKAAIALASAAFLAGMVVMCLLCRLLKPCGKGACKAQPKKASGKKDDQKFEKRNPHPAPADGSIEIYVGNLSYEMTDDQLRELFVPFGKVNSARIVINRYTNKSKGFGFVQMPNRAEVDKAVEALNDKDIQGRKIKCNIAKNTI